MNLGFYYHIPLHSGKEFLKVPAYLGVFLDSIAAEVDKLILFMHEANQSEKGHCDYILKGTNIVYYTLGPKKPAWNRFLKPWDTLKKIKNRIKECDVLLIRAPSPLAPAFYSKFHNSTSVVLMIVGDYLDGVKYLHQPFIRKRAIQYLSRRNDRQLRKVITNTFSLVNSLELYEKYKNLSLNIHLIRTTTISQCDILTRTDTCRGNEILLLYTGRIDLAKGLRELVMAFIALIQEQYNIRLLIAGWEDDKNKPIEKLLMHLANVNGADGKISFLGRLTLTPDLFNLYRKSDIYIIPSYHEGFPRCIWEAMASGLPVIATKVGSIPAFIENSALLIEPKNTLEIVSAIKKIIENPELRKSLIEKGYQKAKENTLEIRVKEIADILNRNFTTTSMGNSNG